MLSAQLAAQLFLICTFFFRLSWSGDILGCPSSQSFPSFLFLPDPWSLPPLLVWDVLLLLVIYMVIVILVVTCSHARADFCFFVFSGLRSIPQESFKKLRGVSPWDTLDATQRISGASNWKLLAIQFREHRIRDVQRSEYELRINRSRRHFQFKIFGDSERRN